MADGTGPRIRHLDDVPWEEVRKIDYGERTASVREKWLDFSPRFLSLLAEWDPGMMIHAHGHNSNHIVYVLEGDMTCGDVRCGPGTLIAGDQGVVLFEVMMGDPRSFPADEEAWEQLLAERGAKQAPNPNIALPDWLEDTRT